jgi:hypothetical protein
MHRLHTTLIALLLSGCAVAGAAAAIRIVHLGARGSTPAPERVGDSVVAARQAKLDTWQAQLAKARASRPPALPKVPTFAPVVVPAVPARQVAAAAPAAPEADASAVTAPKPATQAVTYVQPPPVVTYRQAPTQAAPAAQPTTEREDDHEGSGGGTGGDDGRDGGD